MSTAQIEARKPNHKHSGGCGCGCRDTCTDDSCCDLVCPERPNYFCGHLLTDADLRAEQNYHINKRKLYHRSLHGDGIVCGLRLECDPKCDGGVVIGEGFAIDDCGNDLIVCAPQRLDVVSVARERGWLIADIERDPCLPEDEQRECSVRQCFYVTACYEEEPRDHQSPLAPGCCNELTSCEPTRIRETVRFDLLDCLPDEPGPLEAFRERLTNCFKLFSEGPFAQALNQSLPQLGPLLQGQAQLANNQADFDLFCKLRGLLLLYLDKHPDRYNCTIEDEIRAIPFPRYEPGYAVENYGGAVAEAFCRLFSLALKHVYSCVFGELVPPCPEPHKASCVVLGTVVIENGCLVQVCNCPRDYVWSFANFFEVVLASILGPLACETEAGAERYGADPCCREFELDCGRLVREMQVDQKWMETSALAGFDMAQSLFQSARHGLDFSRADAFSPRVFEGLSMADAQAGAKNLGIDVEFKEAPRTPMPPDIAAVLRSAGLQTSTESVLLSHLDGQVVGGRPLRHAGAAIAEEERAEWGRKVAEAHAQSLSADRKVQEMSEKLARFEETEGQLRHSVQQSELRFIEIQRELEQIRTGRVSEETRHPVAQPVADASPGLAAADEAPRQCAATTKTGTRCANMVARGSEYCGVHRGLAEASRTDEGDDTEVHGDGS